MISRHPFILSMIRLCSVAERSVCQVVRPCRTQLVLIFWAGILCGCGSLQRGADPLVVRAQQGMQLLYVTTDRFLKFEQDHRAQYPALKPPADRLRVVVPRVLQWTDAAVQAYRRQRTPGQRENLVTAVAGLETLLRTAQAAAVDVPAFQPPLP